MRGFTKSRSIPSTMYHNSTPLNCYIDKVNTFNNYFYSVFNKDSTDLPSSDLQNTSNCSFEVCFDPLQVTSLSFQFDSFGYLPCKWKVHKIVPVFKSGDPTHLNNYQPISLLSNTSKVLERILYDKLIGHATSRITPAQF